jgi:hypothetical protein
MKNRPARNTVPKDLLVRGPDYGGFRGGFPEWQFSRDPASGEIFADMLVGWVYNSWEVDPISGDPTVLSISRSELMFFNMPIWISLCVGK